MTHYFDYAATTPVHHAAIRAMTQNLEKQYQNPSAQYRTGVENLKVVSSHRKEIATALGCETSEIYFTSCGTESNNWAIFSTARAKKTGHIITTAIEHQSVLAPCKQLENEGYRVTYLKPDKSGEITPSQVVEALQEDTILVTIMSVNNETGQILPIFDIVTAVKQSGSKAVIHTDATQAFLKVPFGLRDEMSSRFLNVDLCTVSAHKIYGPKGVGALFVRKGTKIEPYLYGGGQESGLRSGTEATASIAGFATATKIGFQEFDKNDQKLKAVSEKLKNMLNELSFVEDLRRENCLYAPHILPISLVGYPSEVVVRFLGDQGIYVSGGSACHRGKPSHVFSQLNLNKKTTLGAIRISLSHEVSDQAIDDLVRGLLQVKERLLPVH